ncbi:MAG TPA: dihydroneopterin aldolase [Alphaproteobacteria bacterium]|nr:dihydroneopterin aldolase [Alphaproteobacteria bacterium]
MTTRRPAPASTIARPIDTGQPSVGLFDPARDHVRMLLRDLVVEVKVGLHPWEQLRPQRLVVNVEAWAYVGATYTDADADGILDYDRLRDVIREEWPKRPHAKLLEPLAEELIQLCFAHPAVEAARVRLEKPDIFSEALGVGIELYRRRSTA